MSKSPNTCKITLKGSSPICVFLKDLILSFEGEYCMGMYELETPINSDTLECQMT